MKMKKFAVIAIVSLMSVVLLACGTAKTQTASTPAAEGKTEPAKTEGKSEPAKTDSKTPKVYNIGETALLDKSAVTVHGVRYSNGDLFKPKEAGNTFAIVDVSLENKSDKEVSVSQLLQVGVSDNDGFKYPVNLVVEGTKGSFDGKVAPGKILRGEIGFDVPQAAKSLEFTFTEPFKKGQLTWKLK